MKKFSHGDLDDVLGKVDSLKSHHREYVKGLLMGQNHGGVTEKELKRTLQQMRRDKSDKITGYDVDRIEAAINEHLNPEAGHDSGGDEGDGPDTTAERINKSGWF